MRASLAAKLPSRRRVMRDLGVVLGAAAAPTLSRLALRTREKARVRRLSVRAADPSRTRRPVRSGEPPL